VRGRIGIHTSIAGSLEGAALRAAEAGANTFQIFSASPRMWRAGSLDPAQIRKLKQARERFDLTPLVVHDNYLINLAAEDKTIRRRSVAAFRGEIERALALGAEYLVMHPGSYGSLGVVEGICTLAESLGEAAGGLKMGRLVILIENTAGGALPGGGIRRGHGSGLAGHVAGGRGSFRDRAREGHPRERFEGAARLACGPPRAHRARLHRQGRLPPHPDASETAREAVHPRDAIRAGRRRPAQRENAQEAEPKKPRHGSYGLSGG
jgi:hypothetical protein